MRSLSALMDMKDRVVVITGGAGHLGLAAAEAVAEMGATVALLDFNAERLAQAVAGLEARFAAPIFPFAVDLENEAAVRGCAAEVVDRFGRADVLMNIAALVGTTPLEGWTTPLPQQSVDTWRRALEVNLTAAFTLCQALEAPLRRSGHGSIINVASTYGLVGPDKRLYEGTSMYSPAAYAASKGGLVQLTRWLATELAPDVRVNTVTPGGIERGQPASFQERYRARTPLGRMGAEEDLKGAFAYLACDLSAYVTGQNVVVDGGWTCW